jgi:hypothetical protein
MTERSTRRFLRFWSGVCLIAGIPGFVLLCVLFALLIGTIDQGKPPDFIEKMLFLCCAFGVSVVLIAVGTILWVLADMLASQTWPPENSRMQESVAGRQDPE